MFADIKRYVKQLNLRNYKGRGDIINFSCPYCGDSDKDKHKSRGYIFTYKNDYIYKCHNCGISKSFYSFLKEQNILVYEEYLKNNLKSKKTYTSKQVQAKPKRIKKDPIDSLKVVSDFPDTHVAKIYLNERKIPSKFFDIIYFTENFKQLINKLDKDKYINYPEHDPRIVFPSYANGKMIFMQGRTIENDNLRYITFKFDPIAPKIYGLDRLKRGKPIYVTEGVLDSFFVDNCLAVMGSDLACDILKPLDPILVYDNEPRNSEIVKKMLQSIQLGYKIVIHERLNPYKDLNEMALNGYDISSYLERNTYHGLKANLEFSQWRKV